MNINERGIEMKIIKQKFMNWIENKSKVTDELHNNLLEPHSKQGTTF